MVRFFHKLALPILLFFSHIAMSSQLPIPVSEDLPLRVNLAPHLTTDWNGLTLIGGELSSVSLLGKGFEWGTTLRGGVESPKLFADAPTTPYFGLDAQLRFIGGVSQVFYTGVQAEVGYTHFFSDARISEPGRFLVTVGIPLAFSFLDMLWVYANPTIVLGNKSPAEIVEKKFWGSLYGAQSDIGMALDFGSAWFYFQLTPRIWDWNNVVTAFDTDFAVGVAFTF